MSEHPAFDLSKVRHELRTPINHILGYCDILLEEESIPPGLRSDLLKIHGGGRQLLYLINHYFDEKTFAKLKLDAHLLFHELRTPVNHILGYSELLEEQAPEAGCPVSFVADLQKIRRAAETWLALMEENLIPTAAGRAGGALSVDPVLGFVTPIPKSSVAPARQSGALLVVDDDPANREMLSRRLQKSGYSVTVAENGLQAIKLLRTNPFDLVLLDLIMPGLDGYQVLSQLKADPDLKHLPVIMISALDQDEGIARCIEMGADDYISKPFNPVFLQARIGASLEKKRLRDQEQKTFQALSQSQKELAANLAEAAQYVESLFPKRMSRPVATDYVFQPCSQLGGDTFGYHAIDEDHLAIYLLDVSGHGVGAALLSVSVMNVIRARTLGGVDFRRPAAVLTALNQAFQMENQNNFFFTIWYGVYSASSQKLIFARGGHPPALLRSPGRAAALGSRGPALGCLPDYKIAEGEAPVRPGEQLLVFSDGVYELVRDGQPLSYAEFEESIRVRQEAELKPETLLREAKAFQGRDQFDDDFSLLTVRF